MHKYVFMCVESIKKEWKHRKSMIEYIHIVRNKFATIFHYLVLFIRDNASYCCCCFFSSLFLCLFVIIRAVGPRSSRLNISFGIQLPCHAMPCEEERNHVQFFFLPWLLLFVGRLLFVIVLRCTCLPYASCSIYVWVSLHLYR